MNMRKLYGICAVIALGVCVRPFPAFPQDGLDWKGRDMVLQYLEMLPSDPADVPGIAGLEQLKADLTQTDPDSLIKAMDQYWSIFQKIETEEFHAGIPEWWGRRGGLDDLNLEFHTYVRYGETLARLKKTDPSLLDPTRLKNLSQMAEALGGHVVHEMYEVYTLNKGSGLPFFDGLTGFIGNFPSSYPEPRASRDRAELMVPVLDHILRYDAPAVEAKLKTFSRIRKLRKEIE